MNTKKNWLIAWSAVRSMNSISREIFFISNSWIPRTPKETKPFIKLAKKCFGKREKHEPNLLKDKLEIHVRNKGFEKEWTGWKYTWVKFEEKDVPF